MVDDGKTVAMLRRRPDETVAHLLIRLDEAIGKAKATGHRPAYRRDQRQLAKRNLRGRQLRPWAPYQREPEVTLEIGRVRMKSIEELKSKYAERAVERAGCWLLDVNAAPDL